MIHDPSSRTSRVTVGLLSWNGRANLESCLPALRSQTDPGVEWETVVLDNASSDGTAEWLSQTHPWVRLIRSESNLGFCGGYNRLARSSTSEFLILLNDDTKPEPGWLQALVAAIVTAPADVAAVGGMLIDWEGAHLDFARGVLAFDGHALQRGFGAALAASTALVPASGEEILFACGGNMVVRRAAFLELDGFDEHYFAYYEDVDLGWRLWAAGWRTIFEPRAVARHRSNASSDRLGVFRRGFLFERNALRTAYKNLDEETFAALMPAILVTFLSRTQALLVENNPGGGLAALDPYRDAEPAARRAPSLLGRLRRILLRVLGGVAAGDRSGAISLEDPRSLAQFRALHSILGNLDELDRTRRRVQARRRRGDREIFRQFPLWIVPTYPGDERLFGSEAFRRLLGADIPLIAASLGQVASPVPIVGEGPVQSIRRSSSPGSPSG